MHGATIKITNAQQAKLNNNYKNTRLQVTKIKGSDFKCFNAKFYISAFVG